MIAIEMRQQQMPQSDGECRAPSPAETAGLGGVETGRVCRTHFGPSRGGVGDIVEAMPVSTSANPSLVSTISSGTPCAPLKNAPVPFTAAGRSGTWCRCEVVDAHDELLGSIGRPACIRHIIGKIDI